MTGEKDLGPTRKIDRLARSRGIFAEHGARSILALDPSSALFVVLDTQIFMSRRRANGRLGGIYASREAETALDRSRERCSMHPRGARRVSLDFAATPDHRTGNAGFEP